MSEQSEAEKVRRLANWAEFYGNVECELAAWNPYHDDRAWGMLWDRLKELDRVADFSLDAQGWSALIHTGVSSEWNPVPDRRAALCDAILAALDKEVEK